MRPVVLAAVVLLLTSCGSEAVSPPVSTATTLAPTSTTVDVRFVRSEAARLCVAAAAKALVQTPGLLAELTRENIAILVESSVEAFGNRDFGDAASNTAAREGCREGLTDFYGDLPTPTTTTSFDPSRSLPLKAYCEAQYGKECVFDTRFQRWVPDPLA